jgi:hypothetical protein
LEPQVLLGAEVVVERQLLEDEADARPDLVALGGDVVARHTGTAGAGREQRAADRDGCGLAGAVGAEEAEQVAPGPP